MSFTPAWRVRDWGAQWTPLHPMGLWFFWYRRLYNKRELWRLRMRCWRHTVEGMRNRADYYRSRAPVLERYELG